MKHFRTITQEQRQYVLDHINDRPRRAVAKAAGVSIETLYRIVRNNGGEICHGLCRRSDGIEDKIRALYPTHTGAEIARRIGTSKNRVNKIARQIGVSHDRDTLDRMREENLRRLDKMRDRRDLAAMGRKRKALYKLEYMRLWENKPQKTRLRLARVGTKAYKAMHSLCRRYDYFRAEGDDPYTLCYDGRTRRAKNEGRFTAKYGIKFEEADP